MGISIQQPIRQSAGGEDVVLAVSGVVDGAEVDQLRARLLETMLASPVVVVDLSGVTRLSRRAVGAVALASYVATRHGRRIVLASPTAGVREMLVGSGGAAGLDVAETVTAALSGGSHAAHTAAGSLS